MVASEIDRLALVVDDDNVVRKLAREHLGRAGFRVQEVDDARETVSVFERVRPDAVLLDTSMPDVDGLTVCARLRSLPAGRVTPIFMMLAENDVSTINRAFEVGATQFITKPINWAVEMNRIRYMVRFAEAMCKSKQGWAAAGRARREWQETFDAIDDVIMVLDPNRRILRINKAATAALDTKRENLTGRHCYELFRGATDVCPDCPVRRVMQDRMPHSGEAENHGLVTHCFVSGTPVFGDDGRIQNIIVQLKDISEKKTMEEELLHAQKMEEVGTLATGIAHDFNNLLQIILGYSELLISENKNRSKQECSDIGDIMNAARQGSQLARQLLTISRKLGSTKRQIDINHEIKGFAKLLRRTIPKMIEIRTELGSDVKPVFADRGQIDQVLMNLSVNAGHAMPEKGTLTLQTSGVTVEEELNGLKPGEYVLVKVSDTGHGMDDLTLSRIFEPFFSTKPETEGTGLGLSMTYGIIRNHEGHITCDSTVGEGTTFSIYLPVAKTYQESEGKGENTVSVVRGTGTILLVDDEISIRRLLEKLLTRYGYKVTVAADGVKGYDAYVREKGRVDAVILDLIMPVMGGKECMEKILRHDPGAKIIIASGYTAGMSKKDAVKAGACGLVSKPYNAKEMLLELHKVLTEDHELTAAAVGR